MTLQLDRSASIAEELLQRAHSPDTSASILSERVRQRPLLLRPSSPDRNANARAKRQHERLRKARALKRSSKTQPLSAKQKRQLGLYDIPRPQQKYSIYEPIHRMWCEYMREILGLTGEHKRMHVDASVAGPLLCSADYHGALVEVVRSRCASRVGLGGIVVKDTKYTMEIVTRRDVLKTVPKEHTGFRFEVPFEEQGGQSQNMMEAYSGAKRDEDNNRTKPLVFELHGSQFESRAPDRANKKFRLHLDPNL